LSKSKNFRTSCWILLSKKILANIYRLQIKL
jgi:hypothetical protein